MNNIYVPPWTRSQRITSIKKTNEKISFLNILLKSLKGAFLKSKKNHLESNLETENENLDKLINTRIL